MPWPTQPKKVATHRLAGWQAGRLAGRGWASAASHPPSPLFPVGQRDLPIGILCSLGICVFLYVGVSAVLTGMVPYWQLDAVAPLASAFVAKGLRFVSGVIDLGAVVGLTTTLLAGLYVQSRLYMALARDGLLPPGLAHVESYHHTPRRAQILVGVVAGTLGGLYDVASLSHILSVGVLVPPPHLPTSRHQTPAYFYGLCGR